MKIKCWGVRGSIPTSGSDTTRYGGSTSCLVVSENDQLLVLDGGSGMQQLYFGSNIAYRRIDILLTHFHLDHLQGLGFFKPLFDPGMEVHIWGPTSSTHSLHSRLSRYLSPPLFPVLIRDLPCKLHLHEIENSDFNIGSFNISSRYVIHPGPTVGFRIRNQKSSFTYIPDHEPALGCDGMINEHKWVSGFDIANHTDLLYHDAQYTPEEYKIRIGWGHSSMLDTLRFAAFTGAKQLLLAHHDPGHTDDQLDDFYSQIQQSGSYPFNFEMAREGMEIELP